MSTSQPTDLTLEQALKLVRSYDCHQVAKAGTVIESTELRNSLKLITSLSTSQNLGICADNFQQGFAALCSYLQALGYPHDLTPETNTEDWEAVYLKFSTQTMSYYASEYTGSYRGVLVACQSEAEQVAGTYGHFPLDLFLQEP